MSIWTETRQAVFDALDTAFAGGHEEFTMRAPVDEVVSDLYASDADIEEMDPPAHLVERYVKEWRAEQTGQPDQPA